MKKSKPSRSVSDLIALVDAMIAYRMAVKIDRGRPREKVRAKPVSRLRLGVSAYRGLDTIFSI